MRCCALRRCADHVCVWPQTFFKKVDVDGDNSITQDEAIKFWGKNFAKVNATAMFNEVDSDGDGARAPLHGASAWIRPAA